MCRAVWALAVGPDEEACRRLRRAAGADVQVVAMATDLARARELVGETEIDVAIVDAATPDAYGIVAALRRSHPKLALVWVGDAPPEAVHATAPDVDPETIPGAVTRALLARRGPSP
jgi:DNA-binding NarL/FixJ family response regulator